MTEEFLHRSNDWHLDKRVQVSHVLATATAVLTLVVYMTNIKQDVEVVKSQISAALLVQRERDDRQDKATMDMILMLRVQLDRMEAKQDRFLESSHREKGEAK